MYPLGAAPAQAGGAEEHAAAPAHGEETATAMRQPVLPSMQGRGVEKAEKAVSAEGASSAESGEDAASAEGAASAERRTPGPSLSRACRLRTEGRADIGDYEMGDDGAGAPASSSAEASGWERTRPPVAADAKMDPPRKKAASAELDDSERANRDVVAKINTLLTSSRADGTMEMAEQAGTKSGGFSVCE